MLTYTSNSVIFIVLFVVNKYNIIQQSQIHAVKEWNILLKMDQSAIEDGSDVCMNCGQVVRYEFVQEYINFYQIIYLELNQSLFMKESITWTTI